jgi:hypothetical protein
MQTIYEDENIKFVYNTELKCLIQHWNGYIHDGNYKEANLAMLNLLEEYPIKRIISVTYDKFQVSPRMITWSHEMVLHELVEKGLTHVAFVMSNHQLAQFSIAQFVEDNREDVIIQVFHFYPEAMDWISSQE